MLAALLTLVLFGLWWLVGLAALVLLRADVRDLRVALSGPTLGTALTIVPLFALSKAGVPMRTAAWPVVLTLLVGAFAVLVWRRPRVHSAVAVVFALCLADLLLVGRPMFEFGFDWVANANGDMALYVLSATQFIDHGLLTQVDTQALADNRNFSTSVQTLHLAGLRPGSQITLAAVSVVTGRSPSAIYMPMLFALNMSCIAAAGALAMQAARRWWAAAAAAALLVISPLAAYGVLQQLMPQVWGLALSVTLFAWLMRPSMHDDPGPTLAELVVVSVLAVALFIVYPEVGASVAFGYVLYLGWLALQGRISFRAVRLLWGVPLVATALVENTFLPRALSFFGLGLRYGATEAEADVQLFGYAIVPSALAGAAGLQRLFASPSTDYMQLSIAAGAVLFTALFAICLITGRQGSAAAFVLLGDVALLGWLVLNNNDFGLFKLYMYMQPFVAAVVGVWLAQLKNRMILTIAIGVLAVVGVGQLATLNVHVERSRDPVDLPDASDPELLPRFRQILATSAKPVVSITDNFVLAPLEAAGAGDHRIYFVSRPFFGLPWTERTFPLSSSGQDRETTFVENVDASRLLTQRTCTLALPTGSQLAVNRRTFPEGGPPLVMRQCSEVEDLLVYVVSSLGQPATIPDDRTAVSFSQLEGDPSFPGRSFSGFGRYALFQLVNASPRVRVALEYTTSAQSREEAFGLPPAEIVGSDRVSFPVVGSGSARVISPPLRPRMIAGRPYVVLDMGRDGLPPIVPRPGVTGLWGTSVSLDPRVLTSHVRDVSLIPSAEYAAMAAPAAITSIPADLANANLEYSGIFEDGWIGRRAYARLAGGPSGLLVVRALVLSRPQGQELRVIVNGRVIDTRRVAPGVLDLRLRLPASRSRRTIELRWAGVTRLAAPDPRQAAARLTFLGVPEPPAALPSSFGWNDPGLVERGIFDDGWVEKDSHAVLASGPAGTLVVRAQILPRAQGQHLRVTVNGRHVASRAVGAGEMTLRVSTPASRGARRVELHWAGVVPLSAPDTRRAAARLTFLGLAEPPQQIAHFPDDLKDPGLVYRGIFDDGWLAGQSQLVLAGGKPANLVLQAQVVSEGQRIEVRVNGRTVASKAVASGDVELRVPLPASTSPRTIELQFAGTTRLKAPDTRHAAARLTFIGLEAQPGAPSSVSIPADLAKPGLEATGVYADGWLEQSSVIVLRGGKAEDLVIRAEVPSPKGQRLQVLVNGKAVASQAVEPGGLDLRVPVPASRPNRRIELRFAGTIKLKAPDTRRAAALLQSIELKPRE